MSYNKITVSAQNPDSKGEIQLDLSNITSVSSPLDKQVLAYDGVNWISNSPSWISPYERALNSTSTGTYILSNYLIVLDNPAQPVGQQRFLYWHRNTGSFFTNYVSNANNDIDQIFYSAGSTNIFYKVRINNAGFYRLFFKFSLDETYSPDNSSVEYQWANGDASITYSPRVRCKKPSMKQVPCIGYINASGGEEIGLYKHAIYNNPRHPLGYFNYLMIIEKVS